MPSKRSFFNRVTFWGLIRRYWPLWAMYGVAMVLIGPVTYLGMLGRNSNLFTQDNELMQSVTIALFAQLFFVSAAPLAVFSTLYRVDSAVMEASLPISRKARYWTSVLAGFAAMEGINLLILLLILILRVGAGNTLTAAPMLWFLAITLQTVTYYGFGCCIALLTGKLLPAALLLGLLHFAGPIFGWLWDVMMDTMLRGYSQGYAPWSEFLLSLSPTLRLYEAVSYSHLTGFASLNWGSELAYAAIGIAFMLLGMALYQRRPVERAGEAAAFRPVKPLLYAAAMVFGALSLGLLFYALLFTDRKHGGSPREVLDLTLCLLAAALIVWLLVRRVIGREHGFRSLLQGFWIPASVVLILCVLGLTGGFGWAERVPQMEELAQVSITVRGEEGPVPTQYWQELTRFHKAAVDEEKQNPSAGDENAFAVYLHYQLNDGSSMERRYDLRAWRSPSDALYLLQQLLDQPELTESIAFDGMPQLNDNFVVTISTQWEENSFSGEKAWRIYEEGLLPDIRGGIQFIDLSQGQWTKDTDPEEFVWLNMQYMTEDGNKGGQFFGLTEQYSHTMELLRSMGLLDPVQ